MWRGLLCTTALFTISIPAVAWEFTYIEGDSAGTLSACGVENVYTDGWFLLRLFGEDMDFIVAMDHLTLPYGQQLGNVALNFSDHFFILSGSTRQKKPDDVGSSTIVFHLEPRKEDYANLFDSFKNEARVSIVFPNGDSYGLDLAGSAAALLQASECWKNRPTGPYTNNPFAPNADIENPFRQAPSAPSSGPLPPDSTPSAPAPAPAGNPFTSA